MTARLDVTPKTTEQNRIVRTGKFEVEVTNSKKLRSTYCNIEAMKLTTDRYEASRGLFATAERLVCILFTQNADYEHLSVETDFSMSISVLCINLHGHSWFVAPLIKPPVATFMQRASPSVRLFVCLFVCLSVCLSPNCKNTIFSKTKQFTAMVIIDNS